MEVKDLSMEEVRTFMFCPMQYHLRYRLGFPWFEASMETGIATVIRQTHLTYFRLESTGARDSLARTEQTLAEGIRRLTAAYPARTASLITKQYEVAAAMLVTAELYVPGRDEVIAGDLPVETWVQKGNKSNTKIRVTGTLDAVYNQFVKQPTRRVVGLTFVSSADPFEDFVRFPRLRAGFAHSVLRKIEPRYDVQVVHRTIPTVRAVWRQLNIMSRRPPVPEAVGPKDQKMFRVAVQNVQDGIDSGYALPAAEAKKCKHCPYDSVCDYGLASATKESTEGVRRVLRRQMMASPLFDWPTTGRLK